MRCLCYKNLVKVDIGEYICTNCGRKLYSLRVKMNKA